MVAEMAAMVTDRPKASLRRRQEKDEPVEEDEEEDEESGEDTDEEEYPDDVVVFPTITETVWDANATQTYMVTIALAQKTVYEDVNHVVTSTFIPPAQTLCVNDVDVTTTETFQGEEQTEFYVDYVTVTTEQTIWIGQTTVQTYSDYHIMTQCWQGGGWYGFP